MGYRMTAAMEWLLLIYLIFCTWSDVRRRQIWCPPAWLLIFLSLAIHLIGRDLRLVWLQGLVPGMVLFGLTFFCGQAIGQGDCLVLMTCGCILGLNKVLELMFWAFVFAGSWAVLLMARKRAGRKTQLPFMPFLLAARILLLLG